ncbi:MAG: hypothetical protein M3024_14530 [Candidatus Dormibacteraeota bacterium]|nr:hypothetical protein [Candidatus Dormibacteraeota bacterium]
MSSGTRLRLLAAAAGGIGLTTTIAPALAWPVARLQPSPAAGWALRMFGLRELCLATLLWQAAAAPESDGAATMRRVVTVSQAADLALTTWLAWRGAVGHRLWLLVASGVIGTVVVSGWPHPRRRPLTNLSEG